MDAQIYKISLCKDLEMSLILKSSIPLTQSVFENFLNLLYITEFQKIIYIFFRIHCTYICKSNCLLIRH